jgi:2-oxoglutarate ferredoxin oxidoreductase subunit gamma
MGTLIANAAMLEGKEVIFHPAYIGKIRSGASTCYVHIGDTPTSTPIVSQYDVIVVLTLQALKKLEPQVKPGGVLVWENSNIKEPPEREDVHVYGFPAYRKAIAELKNVKVMNMIMLGALLKTIPLVKKDSLLEVLKSTLPTRTHDLLPLNLQAIELGMSMASQD